MQKIGVVYEMDQGTFTVTGQSYREWRLRLRGRASDDCRLGEPSKRDADSVRSDWNNLSIHGGSAVGYRICNAMEVILHCRINRDPRPRFYSKRKFIILFISPLYRTDELKVRNPSGIIYTWHQCGIDCEKDRRDKAPLEDRKRRRGDDNKSRTGLDSWP